jgi:4-carboxymuconolactone decarboxylase
VRLSADGAEWRPRWTTTSPEVNVTRVPALSRADLSEEARRVYDEIMTSRGEVDKAFQILLTSPELLRRIAHLGSYIRYESSLPAPIRECVILATARELKCRFEWASHEPQARKCGVSETTIQAIRNGELPSECSEAEDAVIRFVYENLRDHEITDATFGRVQGAFGIEGTAELAATVGYYSMLAGIINVFDVG